MIKSEAEEKGKNSFVNQCMKNLIIQGVDKKKAKNDCLKLLRKLERRKKRRKNNRRRT